MGILSFSFSKKRIKLKAGLILNKLFEKIFVIFISAHNKRLFVKNSKFIASSKGIFKHKTFVIFSKLI